MALKTICPKCLGKKKIKICLSIHKKCSLCDGTGKLQKYPAKTAKKIS
ncbi:hypothetical protein EDD69_104208 [Thermolongibacillus altinsuensis]|jgi:DnaJ-class molecular chaperone|uniref:Uncharacterized protein n=1 Tax=Thermolongibacillus altinsuensis TaxID=575256 RepID=A0A4R1QFF0_9BACL|nr:hypothetical protein [Thermolongibacillus altinsuensis]TCL51153.1 hypothetical protein EDD69_104208 [Thermolongibacillus altinsuensis]GMB08779.1 hypothetical protein B1no1_14890 [Thermolongibacillus altinsuensis]